MTMEEKRRSPCRSTRVVVRVSATASNLGIGAATLATRRHKTAVLWKQVGSLLGGGTGLVTEYVQSSDVHYILHHGPWSCANQPFQTLKITRTQAEVWRRQFLQRGQHWHEQHMAQSIAGVYWFKRRIFNGGSGMTEGSDGGAVNGSRGPADYNTGKTTQLITSQQRLNYR